MSNEESKRRNFGRSLLWILRSTLIAFLLLALLLAVFGGGYLGYLELQRSFGSVNTRLSAAEQSNALLRESVNTLIAQNPEQQRRLETLQREVAALQRQLDEVQRGMSAQETAVFDLTGALFAANEGLTGRTATLETGIAGIQGDLITNTSQLDALGGELDGLRAQVGALSAQVSELRETAVIAADQAGVAIAAAQVMTRTVSAMQETLVLYRAWELVTRARLRLLENNLGLAAEDIRQAEEIVALLAEIVPEEEAAALGQAQVRLAQALASLPGSPAGAAQDLERAWDELDRVLALRIGLAERPSTPVTSTPSPAAQP